jgi:hypothetical protein
MSRYVFFRTLALGAPLLSATNLLAQTPEPQPETAPDAGNLRTFVELARSDLRHERSIIFAQNLTLTESEAVEFWPVQREYEDALVGLLDERYALVVQFIRQSDSMTDPQATSLANKAFDLEDRRTALKRKYFKKFCKLVPAVKAARFFQIDTQLNTALDLQVAALLPLIK